MSAQKLRSSMSLSILGCFTDFLCCLFCFTKARSMPTPSCRWVQNSNPCISAILSWQQQSSRLFFGTPSILAAYGKLSLFLPLFGQSLRVSCSALHCLTSQMASPMVLSLLRSSREVPLGCSGSVLGLNRSRIKLGSIKCESVIELWTMRKGRKALAYESYIWTVWVYSGQQCLRICEKLTSLSLPSRSASIIVDWWVSMRYSTMVFVILSLMGGRRSDIQLYYNFLIAQLNPIPVLHHLTALFDIRNV